MRIFKSILLEQGPESEPRKWGVAILGFLERSLTELVGFFRMTEEEQQDAGIFLGDQSPNESLAMNGKGENDGTQR